MKDQVSKIERDFIREYSKTGNGTRSYMAIRPNVSVKVAEVSACKMLRRARVQDALQEIIDKDTESALPNREKVLNKLWSLAEKAGEVGQYGSSVNAVREYGKICGMYEEKEDGKGYHTLVQNMISATNVQINVEPPSEEES